MRVLLGIEYDGTAYCGWQRQKNGTSVQAVLMQVWYSLTGERVTFHGSGRTDAGVHALCQCAHFDTQSTIPCQKMPFAINTKLPKDVRILWAINVPDNFHARFDVQRKTYIYKLYFSPHESSFLYKTHAHVIKEPNIEAMQFIANQLLGTHDFKAMQATGGHVLSTVRTLYSINISQRQNIITFTVCGNGFLYNMVRILVGTLLYVGWGWLNVSEVLQALKNQDRKALGKTLPACGLYLAKVEYPIEIPQIDLENLTVFD